MLADFHAVGASGIEGTAVNPLCRFRRQSVDLLQPVLLRIQFRNGIKQALCIWMTGIMVNLAYLRILHHLARIHDGHLIADLRNDTQIVGDQDHGGSQLFFQPLDQIHDLGLDCHIQGRGRFICNDHLRTAGQCNGDHHPLFHAAGKLMGIIIGPLSSDSYHLQQSAGLLKRFLFADYLVKADHLHDLIPHLHGRI